MSAVVVNSKYLPYSIKRIIICVVAALTVLTSFAEMLSDHSRQPEVSKDCVMLLGAFSRSQGIANDGESFFFSSKCSLLRTELDGITRLEINANAIPRELADQYGLAHIGGISFYDGKIYAGLEDSKVWDYPTVAVYDAVTLKFTGEYYILDPELHDRGLPWVTVDPVTGYLYACDNSKNATSLYVYDTANAMTPVGKIALSEPVERIQGAEFWNGDMYAATNDATQAIYKINVTDGTVTKYFDRNLTSGSEGEGMTVLETPDGAVFHAIDMGPLFINAYIRHYAPV